jgi:tetratricopeptide (TPR) repeat protein
MRIFLSYGHDQNEPLVERIRHDLSAAGFDVWIDHDEIVPGEEWRRRIVDGLMSTDWALAFLSKHSTRDPGVCLDEIAIALNIRGGIISTILVENASDVDPPVTLSHIQWLDMHDWRERKSSDPGAFEPWYADKLRTILDLLNSPNAKNFAGEIDDIGRRLDPASQAAEIPGLLDGFVGRDWLVTLVENWRLHQPSSRLFFLTGDPGSGKSAFSAWLAHHGKANVISLSLCRYNLEARSDAARIIRTLAFQVATRLADYRALLLKRLIREDPDGSKIATLSAAELFDWLLVQPLRYGLDGGRRDDRYVIIIDSLDETIHRGTSELALVLNESADLLPDWIALLVSSRPEAAILNALAGRTQVAIAREDANNRADLRRYALSWLAEGSADDTSPLIDRVVAAADGNFMYLRKLREGVLAGIVDLQDPEGLPPGLKALYLRWFQRQFRDRTTYEQTYRPLIAMLVAADFPVPETLIAKAFSLSCVHEFAAVLEGLGGLFERGTQGLTPFHKSLRDWLIDMHAAGAGFVVDLESGRRNLLNAVWQQFGENSLVTPFSVPDAFLLAELPVLLNEHEAESRLSGLDEERRHELVWYSGAIAKDLERRLDWERALSWWQTLRRIARTHSPSLVETAHEAEGRIAQLLGRSGEAIGSYQAALKMAEQLAATDPIAARERRIAFFYIRISTILQSQGEMWLSYDNAQSALDIFQRLAAADPENTRAQRDLSVAYNRHGEIDHAWGHDDAMTSYELSRKIRERLVAVDPANIQWQRELSVSYINIGDVLKERRDFTGALRGYRAAMDIVERLAALHSESEQWQHDLSISHERIGDILQHSDLDGALEAYRASSAIREELTRSDPGNARLQYDFSTAYVKIGDILQAQGHLADALDVYRQTADIREQLIATDPLNLEWQRGLAISHERIGEVLQAQDNVTGAIGAQRASFEISKRAGAGLFVSHMRMGELLQAQGNLDGALREYRAARKLHQRTYVVGRRDVVSQRAVMAAEERIGEVLKIQGDLSQALNSFRVAMQICAKLAAINPKNDDELRHLASAHSKVADVLEKLGLSNEALDSYSAAIEICEALVIADPDSSDRKRDLDDARFRGARIAQALGSWDGLPPRQT